MKKIFLLFLILITLFVAPLAFAQADETTESVKVEYTLPYPGILPDSPLYFLKAFRDRIVSILISDPIKKAEFNLLQADKRLGAGVALFEKGKKDLSESTISKGENYFEDGIKNIELAKKQGRDIGGLLGSYELSAKKHLEILSGLKTKTSGNLLKKFEVLEKRMQEFASQVERIKLQQ